MHIGREERREEQRPEIQQEFKKGLTGPTVSDGFPYSPSQTVALVVRVTEKGALHHDVSCLNKPHVFYSRLLCPQLKFAKQYALVHGLCFGADFMDFLESQLQRGCERGYMLMFVFESPFPCTACFLYAFGG